MDYVEYEDFKKLDIRIGTIVGVKDHPNADKLYIILVDFGEESERQLVGGLKEEYSKDQLMGKQVAVIVNLKPVTLRGIESNGMLLAAVDKNDNFCVLTTEKDIANNSKVM